MGDFTKSIDATENKSSYLYDLNITLDRTVAGFVGFAIDVYNGIKKR